MSSDQPYNELGQILANGGDIALGIAISRGWSGQQIALLFSRRFEPMDPTDRQRLINLAETAVQAANLANEADLNDPIDLNTVPVNPFLFGDDPAGRRGKVAYRFSVDEGVKWFEGRVDVADLNDVGSMLQATEDQARNNWGKYPEGNKKGFGGDMPHLMIELQLIVRRF